MNKELKGMDFSLMAMLSVKYIDVFDMNYILLLFNLYQHTLWNIIFWVTTEFSYNISFCIDFTNQYKCGAFVSQLKKLGCKH